MQNKWKVEGTFTGKKIIRNKKLSSNYPIFYHELKQNKVMKPVPGRRAQS